MNFKQAKIKDSPILFIDGDRSKRYPSRNEFVDSGVMFLNAESIKHGRINKDSVNFITQTKYDVIKKGRIKFGDLLLTTRGNGIGDCSYVHTNEKGLINAQMLILRIEKEEEIDSRYLYYYFKTEYVKELISIFSSGSAQPQIPIKDLKHVPILIPSKRIQKKIAAILTAYDDLIEINNKRIQILEKMAEEIYREWFVRMRFPGYEIVRYVKGIPESWSIKKIGSLFKVYLGGTPSRENTSFWGGSIPWINSGEINNLRIIKESEFITEIGYQKSATRKMPMHTTVIAITGATLGQVSFTEIEVCANQSVVGVYDEKDVYNFYLFRFIKYSINNLISKQGGGGQQHINKDIVKKEPILIPDITTIKHYNEIVEPIYKDISNLYFSVEKINKILQILLPRLISGKLDVENLDVKFPPSMEEVNA